MSRLADLLEEDIKLRREERGRRRREEDAGGFKLRDGKPRRFDTALFLESVPGLASQFQAIPPEFWTTIASRTAQVSCPCGCTPEVPEGELRQCEGESCERYYLAGKRTVFVANSPTRAAAPPDQEEAPSGS
jgi:hypothetical protein